MFSCKLAVHLKCVPHLSFAMGVTSLLLLRGDDLPENHRPKVKQVFELGGKELIETARYPEHEGVALCAKLLQELGEIPGVSGAHLMTPGDPASIPAAIQSALPSSRGGT